MGQVEEKMEEQSDDEQGQRNQGSLTDDVPSNLGESIFPKIM